MPVGTWHKTGDLSVARAGSSATLLPNGLVLVAGGIDADDERSQKALRSAELYDPASGTWRATGSMASPRTMHTATLLSSGLVLVAGGLCPGLNMTGCPSPIDPDGAIRDSELYDPRTGEWSKTGSMTTERFLHTATLLSDGRVLVAGAEHGMPDAILASAEIYDPADGTWTETGTMTTGRTQQFAVALLDGRVLVVGGIGPVSATEHDVLSSAELYDPNTRSWTATGSLATPRAQGGTAVRLEDGRVLIAGGDGPGEPMLASAEVFDPFSGQWIATASMAGPRVESAAAMLVDGSVLVTGGFSVPGGPDALLASAEVFEPGTGRWRDAGRMPTARFGTTATVLRDGRVLVAGGIVGPAAPKGVTASADLYAPAPS